MSPSGATTIRPSRPLVAVVILNFNRLDDTLACLASVAGQTAPSVQPIVLNYPSTSEMVDLIRRTSQAATVVALEENRGYAGNNNVGLREALDTGADWIFVLNEDTVLAAECIERLVDEAERDPAVGIAGPMVYHHDEPTVIQSAGGWLDRRWRAGHAGQNEDDRGQFDRPRDVPWVTGCALLVRREVVRQIGGLDERFFYYWEETEWCIRARRAGWRIRQVPSARVWHKGVARVYRPGPHVTYYDTRNHLLLLATHRAPLMARVVAWLTIVRTVTSWSIRPTRRDKRAYRNAMLHGALDFLRGRWGRRPDAITDRPRAV
jgi:GT2 family glycosyltransferase